MKITKTANTGLPITPAWTVTVTNTGGLLPPGTDNMQEAIDAILAGLIGAFLRSSGGEVHVIDTSHPTLSGSSTWDLANGNVHPGTLTADTGITTTGWPAAGTRGVLQWSIEGDGISTPTFNGVTWIGSAPGVIGAGEFLHGLLFSDDAGTVIWGAVAGDAAASTDGMVPYLIPTGQAFTVPINKQALKAMPITVDGTLVVDGYLLEVA
jgi:hypothetical protein